jgi:hypothetical protein
VGAHPDAFAGLAIRISRTKDPIIVDELLDQWNDWRTRATEWDAQQWGFDLNGWMKKERAELAKLDLPRFESFDKKST